MRAGFGGAGRGRFAIGQGGGVSAGGRGLGGFL